jgi:hypothetical protein
MPPPFLLQASTVLCLRCAVSTLSYVGLFFSILRVSSLILFFFHFLIHFPCFLPGGHVPARKAPGPRYRMPMLHPIGPVFHEQHPLCPREVHLRDEAAVTQDRQKGVFSAGRVITCTPSAGSAGEMRLYPIMLMGWQPAPSIKRILPERGDRT